MKNIIILLALLAPGIVLSSTPPNAEICAGTPALASTAAEPACSVAATYGIPATATLVMTKTASSPVTFAWVAYSLAVAAGDSILTDTVITAGSGSQWDPASAYAAAIATTAPTPSPTPTPTPVPSAWAGGTATVTWIAPTLDVNGNVLATTPGDALTGYSIECGTSATVMSVCASPVAGSTSYVFSALAAGTYYYAVAAVNAAGTSAYTGAVSTTITAPAIGAPTLPSGVAVTSTN